MTAAGAGPGRTDIGRRQLRFVRTPRRTGADADAGTGTDADIYVPPQPRERRLVASADGTIIQTHGFGPPDGPVVVLVHGWTCSIEMWAPQVRALARNHCVLAYDLRGHGGSAPAGPAGFTAKALAEDLKAVLTECVPTDRRVTVAGHSMGAMSIVAFAGEFPALTRSRIAAVLLASTALYGLVGPFRLPGLPAALTLGPSLTRRIVTAPLPVGPVTPLHRLLLRRLAFGPTATPEQVAALTRLCCACPPRTRAGWGAFLADLDLREAAARLDVPAVVVHGTADLLTPVRLGRELATTLPRPTRLVELPDVGHMTPLERAVTVTELIRNLADEHLTASPAAG